MSVVFGVQTDTYTTTNGPIPGDTNACTVIWWVKLGIDANNYQAMWSAENAGATDYLEMATDPDGVTPILFQSTGTDPTLAALAVGSWYRMAVTVTAEPPTGGQQDLTLYRGLGAAGALTSDTEVLFNITPLTLYIGGASFPGEWLRGSLANWKQYNAVLTVSEIEAEWASWTAVRTLNLVRHYKFQDAERSDYSGNGHDLQDGTSAPATDPDDPPITVIVSEAVKNSRALRTMRRAVS